ncbi:MAG TPA: hydrolase 1, exosortase A system-associated, partial [Novosphingobium sp.]|nr:hydrolase 1, exosortase A system-associated [Novosphingobium sp.]
HSAEDIAAALAALRAAVPGLCYIVAFGNCDGASALMLAGGAGVNALVLANPWTIEQEDEAAPAPPAALRAHYRARLANPAAIRRLLTGQVAPMALLRSLAAMARPRAPSTNSLAAAMAEGLARFTGPVRILLAGRDRTAQAFLGLWNRKDQRLAHCPGASHAFVEAEAREWLLEQILAALAP